MSRGESADANDVLGFDLPPGREYVVRAAGVEKTFRTGTAGKDQVVEIEVAPPDAARSAGALQALRAALAAGPASLTELADRDFARVPLTRTDAATVRPLLWEAHAASIRKDRTGEIKDRVLRDGKLEMPFSFTTFGKKPAGGRSLLPTDK